VEWVVGRNAVLEALREGVPVTSMYVAEATERDARLREAFAAAAERHLSMLEVSRVELDRLTGGLAHQGVALKVPPYDYAHPDDLLHRAAERGEEPLVMMLDGITDPRNLGAVVRSAAAFGAHGVVISQRRAAAVTAGAWKTSAGAAARVPVARTVNLARQLKAYRDAGLTIVGLAADGSVPLGALDDAGDGLVLVVGSEGKGLGRLVRANCDVLVSIPISHDTESLNASVAAGVALYEISRRRHG
jgi:23S rRNA (guanosine2251-2'-O)-methyltransferase